MELRHISIPFLVAEAGGDPWSLNAGLQAGRPARISDLARAFRAAGTSTSEAAAAFEAARRRFDAAWNHRNGEHPINDLMKCNACPGRSVCKPRNYQRSQSIWR